MSSYDISNEYHEWLCDIIGRGDDYKMLTDQLDATRFEWSFERDINRAEDGEELRDEFARQTGRSVRRGRPCSIFEMLIGVARRMNYAISDPYSHVDRTEECFWELVANLGLTDEEFMDGDQYDPIEVGNILDQFIKRSYERNGSGGIFPLRNSVEDQRKVEIWYQMNQYLYENYGV